jgi:hypothetical protein
VLSLRHFGLVLFIPWRVGADEAGAANMEIWLRRRRRRFRLSDSGSRRRPRRSPVRVSFAPTRSQQLAEAPALISFLTLTRARALMARQWSARCYGVARQ